MAYLEIHYKSADETLKKIKEVLQGIESVKKNLEELSAMGMKLDLSTMPQYPFEEGCEPSAERKGKD